MSGTVALPFAYGAVMEFSPTRNGDKENDVAVLRLVLFSKAPFVSFGTVKIGTSKSTILRIENPTEESEAVVTVDRIPSSKGFSVNSNTFTIQPQGSFSLTLTWTPTEEGGLRELIIFNANGVLKHQAVLLGRAEVPQQRKKSLWDAIKNKRRYEKGSPYRGKRTAPQTKMAANKTEHMSRKPQYKRDKRRSPLSSLNDEITGRDKSLGEHSPLDGHPLKSEQQNALNPVRKQWPLVDQENVLHVKSHSSLEVATKETEMRGSSGSLVGKLENKELTKMLNKTLSPIGTPERLKKLMPHVQPRSEYTSPVTSKTVSRGPVVSLTDALALINSDIGLINSSPKDTSSSCGFSDSLEFKSDDHDYFKARPDSPELSEPTDARLTFFVSKKVDVPRAETIIERSKKMPFNCATVIKNKAPVTNCESGRKIKKSRRRLMEKTLELSEGSSQGESGPGTPHIPVREPDTRTEGSERAGSICLDSKTVQEFNDRPTQRRDDAQMPINSRVSSPLPKTHWSVTLSVASPPATIPPMTFTMSSPLPMDQSSPLHCSNTSNHHLPKPYQETDILPQLVSANLSTQEDLFPVHMVTKSRKRKSEEYLRSAMKIDDGGKIEPVKKTKTVAWKREPIKSTQERSMSKRQSLQSKGSMHPMKTSVKTIKSSVSAQKKPTSAKLPLRGAVSLRSSRAQSVKSVKMAAVAKSKLVFVKPTQTAIPRHPLPFAAKNMFYDERWLEKQERGFTWWLNYVLTPDDFKVNTEMTKVSASPLTMGSSDKFSVLQAPTKEEMSFSTYTARRKLNHLRRAACQLFTSETMVKAIKRLENEVEAKRLLIRKDRHLWKDIGERQKVLNWLLSYNPLWLRIGLETIFGELISLESNSDAMGLALFILHRLLWNPDIAAEFRHPKVPHLYKDGHEEALSSFTLKKLLLLVCFLDKAKESHLIEHDPCLFCVDAEFKTSKDLLLAFSRDFLSGEGILPRHLGYLGLPVSHCQNALDEFNFAVINLAVDLKCGIRLVRVMELLIKQWNLSEKLRLPAISRLQKIHNMDIVLQVLKIRLVDLKDEYGAIIDSRDIVDGHREKTLSLLWKIIFSFQVEVILNEDHLREEIVFLRRTLRSKLRLASVRADHGLESSALKTKVPYEHCSTKVVLLMEWARAVCDFYNLTLENFTVTFSDGRVLCYLIHHYHPSLISEESVHHSTTQTVDCSSRGRLELNCGAIDSDSSFEYSPSCLNGPESPSAEFKELLENEKSNFRLVNTAVAFLGGVPAMINPADMSNTIPDEKVVMSYLSFLCARLLDLRNETRAARIIQGVWRNYRLKKDLQLYKERNKAAVKIQMVVKHFLQRCRGKKQYAASIIIQSVWRGFVTRKRLRMKKEAELQIIQNRAATVIQAQWRMFSAMRYFQQLRYNTIVVQAQWRMKRAASAYGKIYWATTVMQRYFRAWILARKVHKRYLCLKAAVTKMQRGYRLWKIQKTQRENHSARILQTTYRKWYTEKIAKRTAASIKIQSFYRMQRCLHEYRKIRRSTLLIQAHYRGHEQRRRFRRHKQQHNSATVIQSAFRGHRVRKRAMRMKYASIVIQRWYRASARRDVERQIFVKMCSAARTIQVAYRRKQTRDLLKKQHTAAIVIQAAFRKFATQKRYLSLKKATVTIQQKYRATVLARQEKADFETLRKAVLTVQAYWRGRADRMMIENFHQCATLIRAHYCRYKAQVAFRSKKSASVVIQRQYRAYVAGKKARKAFLQKRAACVVIEAGFRGMKVRKDVKKKHNAATVIQSTVRMYLSRKKYIILQSAIIIIQSRYRALLHCRTQQHKYKEQKKAALKIQAVYRDWRGREEFKTRNNAATVIQALFRMHRVRLAYLATKCAAIIIQERYRAKILMEQQLKKYKTKKSAAIIIQAAYRGYCARMKITQMHCAAIVIQRNFLMIHGRNKFLTIKSATLIFQQRYRAVVLMRKVQMHYLLKRRAAICLQAAFRGYRVRKQLSIKHNSAVKIQSNLRMYLQRNYYKRLKWASSFVQARYKANKERRQDSLALSAKTHAAIVLQAAFRGMISRKRVKQKHQVAIIIQRAFRAHYEHKRFIAFKSSVLAIQRRYRANVAAKAQMQHYQNIHKSAVIIQAAYRGLRVRKDVACWHQAATLIQSTFRKHREEVKFQEITLSAIIIQRYYRAYVLQKQYKRYYLKVRSSATILQAAFRGRSVRQRISKMHRAATIIQANFKRHKQQFLFRKQLWAVRVLQRRFRAIRQRNLEVKRYQEVKIALIRLQATFRGMKTRRSIKRMYLAATVIQSAFRSHREKVQFQTMRSSAIIIQRCYRAYVLQKKERDYFLKVRSSVISLQAVCRGCLERRRISKMHRAATLIQANFKRHKQQFLFRKQLWAVRVLQRRFRAIRQRNLEVKRYQEVKIALIRLQATFRGMKTRRSIKRMYLAATVIQSAFRSHRERVQFQTMRSSAIIIQRCYRADVLQKKERDYFLKVRSSVISLQAVCRGCLERRRISKMHRAATLIQANFKRHKQQFLFRKQLWAVRVLQRRFRAIRQRNLEVKRYQEVKIALIRLQATFRGMKTRRSIKRMYLAATVIQSAFRSHRERVQFQTMRSSAIIIQRCYRAYVLKKKERDYFLKVRSSVISLQAVCRGCLERRRISKMHRAATLIQANFKRHKQQLIFRKQLWAVCVLQQKFRALRQRNFEVKHYQEIRTAVISLQAAFRGMKSRKSIRQMYLAATIIQAAFRVHCQFKQYMKIKSSVLTIQQRFRATAAAKVQRKQYLKARSAAIIFQAAYRGQKTRKHIAHLHQAATVIQSAYKKHVEVVKFQIMYESVAIIQKHYRAFIHQRQERNKFLKIKQATVILQAAYRGHCVRRDISTQSRAASLIQSYWRCSVQRRIFLKRRVAAVNLQQRVRAMQLGKVQRKKYARQRRAAITLQTHCRAWIVQKQELEAAKAQIRLRFAGAVYHHLSAIKIQRAWRAHWTLESAKRQIHSVIIIQNFVRVRLQRRRYLADRRKVVTAQRAVRRWLARRHNSASVIQHAARNFLLLRRQKRVEQGIVKAQALWRGHVSRRLNDSAKVTKLRHHLRKVSAGAREEDKLRNKTSSALDCILRYKHFSSMLEALKNLEAATRLSPVCCEHMVESGATSVIFTLILSCNRSVPCMDVIIYSIQILLNLSKYHKTIEAVYLVENSVETLVDLLQRYREKAGDKVADKGGSIFTKACFLLVLLLQEKCHAEEVTKHPKVLNRIKSIYHLTVRKYKMDAERNVARQKINASINGSFYVSATPNKSRPVPKFAPDWVLRKDKLKNIVDPLKAIQMLMNTLSIVM
ncbi:abnormal spindle-like microcephaly-associated protein [Phycodurus eques]|uniref:abnormal spindle-like microcephaly-associated protein n=1 Tax=Phycodurus eques TaxID=693459 RepID=UPI002ACDD1D1|nr:abnormal spindle-like microcephaly-associated protein [Phycodurus eques]